MTKCNSSEVNLKSSVYNQSGETYFQRLSAYNCMSSHLRRVHLARSVIDARNDRYIRQKERRCKSASCRRTVSEDLTRNLIDKLALDTSHHPRDFLRMTLNRKFSHGEETGERYEQETFEDIGSSRRKARNDSRNYERNKSRSRKTWVSPTAPKAPRSSRSPTCNRLDCLRQGFKQLGERKHKCGDKGVYCTTTFECMSTGSSSTTRETDSSTNSFQDYDIARRQCEPCKTRVFPADKDEDSKYAKFVYDITREIVQNGLYTDRELQEVFKKHVRENKDRLNTNKMLYEIYQLKISLDVSDDSEDDEELEEQVYARRFSSAHELKPPTPPKVLDENKVIEKLLSYRTSTESRPRTSSPGTKSVVLVDANPDLHVTERDVLLTLIEADISLEQAQHICKSLFHKSKEVPLEMQSSSVEYADTESLQPKDSSSSMPDMKRSGRSSAEAQEKQVDVAATDTDDRISQKDEDVQVEVPTRSRSQSVDSYTETFSSVTKDELLQTENLDAKKPKPTRKVETKEPFPQQRSSSSSQAVYSSKTELAKSRRKVYLGAPGKAEKSRTISHDSHLQRLSVERSSKYRKDQKASAKEADVSKDKTMKARRVAQGSKSSRSSEAANNGAGVAVSSDEKLPETRQNNNGARLYRKPLAQDDYELEKSIDEADEVEEEIDEAVDDATEDELVDDEVMEGNDVEEVTSATPRRASWIESRDVDTDVSETNGDEHSVQYDTIFTETEASNAGKHK